MSEGNSFGWVRVEDAGEEIDESGRKMFWDFVDHGGDLFIQLWVGLCIEGEVTRHHGIQQNAQGPHIHGAPEVLPALRDLWGHVTGCSAKYFESLAWVRGQHTEAKVCEFHYVVLLIIQNILKPVWRRRRRWWWWWYVREGGVGC